MSDVIRLLPDSVANQIAAGEVIQRPSSAIKELMENAADAGATSIKVVVKDAGKTMIQVIDNGVGMSPTDARMAFERHATSKIKSADDLFTLSTMGFRGEALPSICAIAEVDVLTKRAEDKLGTHLIIAGSKVELQEPCVCETGTVITVKKLFYNVPARRKFLKSDSVELSNIVREFERMALVNNRIRLSLDTGNKIIDLRAGSLKQRIVDLWKSSLDAQLIPINVETSLVKIEGFISRPEFARKRNPLQFLIANGRNMSHPYFRKSILGCYESLIAPDTQPCFFLKFEVDPQSIDVNRSPTKDDIKFEYENEIRPILTAAVKAALGKFSAVPSIDFTSDALPVAPLHQGEVAHQPELNVSPSYNPFSTGHSKTIIHNWEELYQNFNAPDSPQDSGFGFDTPFSSGSSYPSSSPSSLGTVSETRHFDSIHIEEDEEPSAGVNAAGSESLFDSEFKKSVAPLCMQYAQRYIITSSREGLMIIDQHRAHVKILFEEYRRRMERMEIVAQGVMFPETIELDPTQQSALSEVSEELRKMGFALEYESDNRWAITSTPSVLKNINPKDIIFRILDSVTEDSVNYGRDSINSDTIRDRVALMMARSAAIKRGDKLTTDEMEQITGELFALPDPGRTPNGNTIFCLIEESRIDRLF